MHPDSHEAPNVGWEGKGQTETLHTITVSARRMFAAYFQKAKCLFLKNARRTSAAFCVTEAHEGDSVLSLQAALGRTQRSGWWNIFSTRLTTTNWSVLPLTVRNWLPCSWWCRWPSSSVWWVSTTCTSLKTLFNHLIPINVNMHQIWKQKHLIRL